MRLGSDYGRPQEKFDFSEYLDGLYGYAIVLSRNSTEAEDLVQETCLRALRAIDGLRGEGSIKSWLFRPNNGRADQIDEKLETNALKQGFLGTAASSYADLVLLLEIGMGLALLAGAVLARKRRFRLHAWCQSAVVLINLAIIALLMVPSFHAHVSPKVPAKLGKTYYSLATAHAALGSVTEIAALYILLSAGTNILPQQFRLTRYKQWMRSILALWWLVLLLGLATYVRWYVPALLRK